MRALAMFILLTVAFPCYAEDPLESLNTVEDTLTTMEQTLRSRATHRTTAALSMRGAMETLPQDERLYFVSDEALGEAEWVVARPCTEEVAVARAESDANSCVAQADGWVAMGPHYWKSRPALPGELRVGMVVVARDEAVDSGWFVATITDLAGLSIGFVKVSAPFRAAVKGLRIVE